MRNRLQNETTKNTELRITIANANGIDFPFTLPQKTQTSQRAREGIASASTDMLQSFHRRALESDECTQAVWDRLGELCSTTRINIVQEM